MHVVRGGKGWRTKFPYRTDVRVVERFMSPGYLLRAHPESNIGLERRVTRQNDGRRWGQQVPMTQEDTTVAWEGTGDQNGRRTSGQRRTFLDFNLFLPPFSCLLRPPTLLVGRFHTCF